MKRLVLVDGNALLHRAYHATPPFTTSQGELVNAVYGFSAMILKIFDELKPSYLAVAWDEKGPTFRHQAYTQYKATRGPTDDNLSIQYKRVHEIVKAFNIPEFSLSGYEADDLIGTLTTQAEKNPDLEVVIVTGDRDIMQLISKRVQVFMPKKTMQDVGMYGEAEFALKFGFSPKQLIDYKGLAGDASDNIPGVNGIGDVSATKLIHKFGSVEEIYKKDNLKTLPPRMQQLLSEGAESAVMSKKLATIELKAPIKLDVKACEAQDFNKAEVIKLFEELEFKSLIKRVGGDLSAQKEEPIKIEQNNLTAELDKDAAVVLQKMTNTGILIDKEFLDRFGTAIKGKLTELEKEIYSIIGYQINLNSPKQLQEVLFDHFQLPVFRKTKTGRSTDEETLQELKMAHPIIPLLLQYRILFKLVSTYIDALPKYIAEDGRVHSTFNVEGAATGRISSLNPNLQNIPIKGQDGAELRKAFSVPAKKILIGADYSQIELRIMAHMADDPGLKKAFKEGLDIHAATAAKIFKIDIKDVSKEQRTVGKTMNFATLYGQGPHALSRQLGISFELARNYIEEYFLEFPNIHKWMQKTLAFGYENGYVETLGGRKRYIPELKMDNRMIKSAGERAAINHPIQGTAADMIKKAMVEIDKELENKNYECKMILQVHDELLFECSPDQIEQIARMIKDKMENALILSVPVVVDLKKGPNWGEMEKLVV